MTGSHYRLAQSANVNLAHKHKRYFWAILILPVFLSVNKNDFCPSPAASAHVRLQ